MPLSFISANGTLCHYPLYRQMESCATILYIGKWAPVSLSFISANGHSKIKPCPMLQLTTNFIQPIIAMSFFDLTGLIDVRHTRALDLRMCDTPEHWNHGCASHQTIGLKDVSHTRAFYLRMCITPEHWTHGCASHQSIGLKDERHNRALD